MFGLPDCKYESEKDTPAYKLFHWSWPVIIPVIYLRTIDEMEYQGVYTTGHQDIDESLAGQSVATTRTLAQLAELLDQGCDIILEDKVNQATRMYPIIMEHLKDWGEYLNREGARFNNSIEDEVIGQVIEDIAKLEGFLKFIHAVAIKPAPKRFVPGSLVEKFNSFGSGISAPEQIVNLNPAHSRPQVDFGVIDIFAEVVQTPTVISRIKKWRV